MSDGSSRRSGSQGARRTRDNGRRERRECLQIFPLQASELSSPFMKPFGADNSTAKRTLRLYWVVSSIPSKSIQLCTPDTSRAPSSQSHTFWRHVRTFNPQRPSLTPVMILWRMVDLNKASRCTCTRRLVLTTALPCLPLRLRQST